MNAPLILYDSQHKSLMGSHGSAKRGPTLLRASGILRCELTPSRDMQRRMVDRRPDLHI